MSLSRQSLLPLVTLASFLMPVAVKAGGETVQQRSYRPLEARSVRVVLASQLASEARLPTEASEFESLAWRQFDTQQWEQAMDSFLSSLEKDPDANSAAEGLVMSVYRSGDYDSAFVLAEQLSAVMPQIGMLMAETVLAEVRHLIAAADLSDAVAFARHFPSSKGDYGRAHRLVSDATRLSDAFTLSPRGGDKQTTFASAKIN